MSKKKRPAILGPDGRPYVTPPKPRLEPVLSTADGVLLDAGGTYSITVSTAPNDTFDYAGLGQSIVTGYRILRGTTKATPLADAVASQVDDLTAYFDGAGRPELPRPAPDLTTYADALESARKKCPHESIESTIYAKGEYQCQDCGRYLSRDEIRKRRGPFGYFFQ